MLDDPLAARVSGQFTRRDGVVDNVVTGDELNALNNFALRRQLLFRANSDLKLRFIADASHQDAAYCTQGFLRVGYRFRSGWEFDVFARNLFDHDYITALTVQTGNSGLILSQPSDPRIVGGTVRVRF